MRRIAMLLLLALLGAMLAACSPPPAAPAEDDEVEDVGEQDNGAEGNEGAEGESGLGSQTVAFTFYDSHAVWCGTCRMNEPVIAALRERFAGQIEFVRVNVDNPADTPLRERFGLFDRSQYALVNAQGEVVQRWFGLLNEERLARDLSTLVQG